MSKFNGTYDFNQVIHEVDGEIMTGYGDGDVITIEYDETIWVKHVGTDGTVTRSKQNQPGATVTMNLSPQSPMYSVLMAKVEADADTGDGMFDQSVEDIGDSGEKTIMRDCFVESFPTRTYGREATEREFVIMCSEVENQD